MATVGGASCRVCGGQEFAKEAGYYYCVECQTQTVELREQEYDLEQTLVDTRVVRGGVTTTTTTSSSDRRRGRRGASSLASWEVHNYVLRGLTDEMCELGAGGSELRHVTRLLWFEYLRVLGVLREDQRPRLGLAGRAADARIVYNNVRHERRKASAERNGAAAAADWRSVRRERAKRRRDVVRAAYERDAAASSTSGGGRSLADVTLSELSSDTSGEAASGAFAPPRYNCAARRALAGARRRTCALHNASYWRSAWALRKDKLYALLCVGVRLTQDAAASDAWLEGDVLRACREGHLSFLAYRHMLPEDAKPGAERPVTRSRQRLPSHRGLRKQVHQLARLLNVDLAPFAPSLTLLTARYCKELNLPDEIRNAVTQLLEVTRPQFRQARHAAGPAPNYEGRTAAFILYVLKLVFGLDGCTEYTLSEVARRLNDDGANAGPRMFDFALWLQFVQYRSLAVRRTHYAASFARREHEDALGCGAFAAFVKRRGGDCDGGRFDMTKEVVDKFLKDLEIYEDVDFMGEGGGPPHSFTPLASYARERQRPPLQRPPLQMDILTNDFSSCSLAYILRYGRYLKKLSSGDGGSEYAVPSNGSHSRCIHTNLNYEAQSEEGWRENFSTNKFNYLFVDTLRTFVLNKKLKVETEREVRASAATVDARVRLTVEQVLDDKNNRDKVGRDSKGRFCVKHSERDVGEVGRRTARNRGRYFVSSWTDNPVLRENVRNSLYVATRGRPLEDVARDAMSRKRKRADDAGGGRDGEYWLLSAPSLGCSGMSRERWRAARRLLPDTLRALLDELGEVCGQGARSLYEELSLVEAYVSYVHLEHPPSAPRVVTALLPALRAHW